MVKITLKLRAKIDIPNSGWKKGDIINIINNILDEQNGLIYYPLSKNWEIIEMNLLEFKPIINNENTD